MKFWQDFIYFFSLQDATINNVLFGTMILGFTCGLVGVLVVLSKKALIVDAVSHSVLPGICIGFMFAGTKNPIYLVSGGMLAGGLAVYLVDWISRISRIKKDASIAITLSVLFSVGVVLLNLIQHSGNSNQSGLTDFLFGKAATIIASDLYVFGTIGIVVIITITVFYQHFKISLFDDGFAKTIGLNEKLTQGLISGLIIISTAVGIQTVGVILMSALIITPASSALFWTNNFKKAIVLSGIFATVSSLIGVLISFLYIDMPTGPWIIVTLSIFALFSAFFSKKGLMTKKIKRFKNKRKMLSDNLLKALYTIDEKENKLKKERTLSEINMENLVPERHLNRGLKILKTKQYIIKKGNLWALTDHGLNKAQKIIRAHNLWELYMENFMEIQPDHVHDSAESIEHILPPELEAKLIKKIKSKVDALEDLNKPKD
tara:strand:+ start:32971 stop:34266 length:1296 start_codon:yes stop_codon:yes gene_type:complete